MWGQTLLLCIFVGVVSGWFSSALIGHGYGSTRDILIGILGALIGGFCFQLREFNAPISGLQRSIGNAFIGSIVLLLAVRFFYLAQHRRRIPLH